MDDKELLKHLPFLPHKKGGGKFSREELENLVEYFREHLSKENGNKIEKCVQCGCLTQYRKRDNIATRQNYIEGAGQLCDSCYAGIYGGNRHF